MVGRRFVVLHAVTKKSPKVKEKDIQVAEARHAEVVGRWHDETAPPIRPRREQEES
jgi:phage-related protein